MQKHTVKLGNITVRELAPSTWKDFKKLFERHGGVWNGCWCMYYHITHGWSTRTYEQNKNEKKELVLKGKTHGLILYNDGEPIGWCQYGTPDELPRIDQKKSYKHPKNFWRLTCFFIDKRYRGKGISKLILEAALKHMKKRKVRMVEAYPIDTSRGKFRSAVLWPGTLKLFQSAGFQIVGSFGKHGLMVRRRL